MLGRRMCSLLAALLIVLLPLAWASACRADDRSVSEQTVPVVRVLLGGDQTRAARLSKALMGPFRRARIELRFDSATHVNPAGLLAPAAPEDVSVAALAFDLSQPDEAVLYVTDRGRARIFVRKFELSGGFDEVQLERLVVAARSSVAAILSGESIGVARQEYERSLQPPKPARAPRAKPRPARPKPGRSLSVASRYEAEWLSGATPAHGPGLMLLRSSGHLAFGATVGGRLPWRYARGDIGVRLATLYSVLDVELSQPLMRSWAISASLGLGLDATLVQPVLLGSAATGARDQGWVLDPFNRAQLGLTHAWSGLWLGGFAGLDVEWIHARYTIDRDGRRETLLTPNLLRPLLAFSFGTVW